MATVTQGLTLVGAGRMGFALLAGWVRQGLAGPDTVVVEPTPSADLAALCSANGIALNPAGAPAVAKILVLAIKPQTLDGVAPMLATLAGPETLVVSILAGKSIADLSLRIPVVRRLVRAMPNTPAAIGRGISGLVASADTPAADCALAERLLSAVGEALWVPDEALMDAVTAVSGSGPAYVFLLAEVLAQAGEAVGLAKPLAMQLARKTVEGAAALMDSSPDTAPRTLRENVTSPGGTTAAALDVLRAADGLAPLMARAVAAAVARGKALSG